MFFKLCGGVLVFLSCTLLGYYYSLRDGFRISDLLELRKALLILKSEIEFSHKGLSEALETIAQRLDPGLGAFFRRAGELLAAKDGEGAGEAWKRAMSETLPHTHLKPEDAQSLERLGETLGCLNRRMQAEGIDMAVMYIDGRTALLRESEAKSKRLYKNVGIACGALIVIILL